MHEDNNLGGVILLCLFLLGLFVLCYDCALVMLFLLLFLLFMFFFINTLIICYKEWVEPEYDSNSSSDTDIEDMVETEVAIIVKGDDISVIS